MSFVSKCRILELMLIIIYVYSRENGLGKINKVSQITVKIVGTGKQHILRNNFSPLPS